MTRTAQALTVSLVLVASAAAVLAGEYPETAGIQVPDWLYASIAAGAVQGLITFGAIKVKLDWLFQRLENLEKKQSMENAETNSRIDSLLMHSHRRASDTMGE